LFVSARGRTLVKASLNDGELRQALHAMTEFVESGKMR